MALDEVDGFAREGVGEVFGFFDGLAAADDGVIGIVIGFVGAHVIGVDEFAEVGAAGVAGWEDFFAEHGGGAVPWWGDKVVAFVCEAEEFIEAMAEGVVGSGAAEVPFSDDAGGVSLVMEELGDSGFFFWEAEAGFFVSVAGGVEFVSEAGGDAAGHEAGAGGGAIGAADVCLGEADAVGGDGIDVWGGDFGVALAGEFSVSEVIGEEDDNIGRGGGRIARFIAEALESEDWCGGAEDRDEAKGRKIHGVGIE